MSSQSITMSEDSSITMCGGAYTARGEVAYLPYVRAIVLTDASEGDTEVLTVNLASYDLEAPEGHAYVKSYSEGVGVAESLVEAGLVEIVGIEAFGPFDATAHLVKVLAAQ